MRKKKRKEKKEVSGTHLKETLPKLLGFLPLRPVFEDDEGERDLSRVGVRDADDACVSDGGMAEEMPFEFGGGDLETLDFDEFLGRGGRSSVERERERGTYFNTVNDEEVVVVAE